MRCMTGWLVPCWFEQLTLTKGPQATPGQVSKCADCVCAWEPQHVCVCACACVWRWLCQKLQASNVHPHKYVESHYWVAIMAFHIICGPLEPRRDQMCSECQWERGSVMPANIHLISTWMFNEIVVEYSLTRFETLQTVINLSLSGKTKQIPK